MSALRESLQRYLSIRRALGYQMKREGLVLPSFVDFLESQGNNFITAELALQWATRSANASPTTRSRQLCMVRGFAKHLSATDLRTEIPDRDLLPSKKRRQTPHIYSEANARALMQVCDRFRGQLKPRTYATLIGLLAATGMRVGEAIALDDSAINRSDQLLVIHRGKFGKSREVALHETTLEVLTDYARKRDRIFPHPRCPSLFVSERGTRLIYSNVHFGFMRLLRWANLADRRPRPRIHDLRHSFAVNTLLRWYREGEDVEHRIATLSTYLGHVNPSSTYWYLTATPELLAIAAQRFERVLGDLP